MVTKTIIYVRLPGTAEYRGDSCVHDNTTIIMENLDGAPRRPAPVAILSPIQPRREIALEAIADAHDFSHLLLREKIGEGGLGAVFRMYKRDSETDSDTTYALKVPTKVRPITYKHFAL